MIIGRAGFRLPSRGRALRFGGVRYPFTFMGVFSLAVGVWMVLYLILHPHSDQFAAGLVTMSAFLMVAFGSFVVYRRFVQGKRD